MFIGRAREIDALDGMLEGAREGRGRLHLLSGEPGIGKTRLADEVATRATTRGFVVAWGRAWETGGAPAYWPWIELLGPLVSESDPDVPARARVLLGHATREHDRASRERTHADPARERFELFDGVGALLRTLGKRAPLLVVLDDLHAADVGSLELLSFVARGLRGSRVAVIGTQRDAESRLPAVSDVLARIAREAEILPLAPLSGEEVAEIVRHETGRVDAALSAAVHDLTDGNPLFLREALHAVGSRRGIESLRDVAALGGVLALVRGRLAGAEDGTRAVLDVASVFGRESTLGHLAEAAGKSAAETRAALDDATARGLLARRGESGDRWVFAHVLVREAFYGELGDERRRALHAAIAAVLERRVASGSEDLLATLAHHALAGLPNGDPVLAVRIARRAASRARAQLAYDDALALLERALATCDEHRVDIRERAEVALALGWAATEVGKHARGLEVFRAASAVAREIGDARMLARAALGQGGEYVLAEIRSELLGVLREALTALEQHEAAEGSGEIEDRRLRARLLARLAAALTPNAVPEEPLGLARQALAMVAGEPDARTRIDVDVGAGAALTDFAPPAERIAVNERLRRDAREVFDRILELRALTRLSCDYLERGDLANADATIAARGALAEAIGHPRYRWQTPLLRSMRRMPNGGFDGCETDIAEARAIAAEAPDPNAQRCIEIHRFSMLLVAGRLDALRGQEAPTIAALASLSDRALRTWVVASVAARAGEKERVAEALANLGTESSLTARMSRATLIEVAVLAGVRDVVERLYGSFDASDDANVCWGPFGFTCGPPIARVLGAAAFALGRGEEATRHCERALALTERAGARAHRAWVHLTWGEGASTSESRVHLERALEDAEAIGMPEVAARAHAAMARHVAAPPRPHESLGFTLRREAPTGDWSVAHGGRTFRLKDVRGVAMLAQLVDNPGREIHALDLASDADPASERGAMLDVGDAGEVIDSRARDAYKKRISDLRVEIAEAEASCDLGRAAQRKVELEALTEQIAAAFGLGGRERRTGSAAERARITVQRRVREAIKKIATEDPELGKHLDWTVRTGTFSAYEPDGRKSGR